MNASCESVERWLDEGCPAEARAAAETHAADCARCRAAIAAAIAVEDALVSADVTASAPAGFTDHVMARVAARATGEAGTATPSFWTALLDEPLIWVAVCLAALYSSTHRLLWAWAESAVPGVAGEIVAGGLALVSANPVASLGLVAVLLPLLGWIAWQLPQWAEESA